MPSSMRVQARIRLRFAIEVSLEVGVDGTTSHDGAVRFRPKEEDDYALSTRRCMQIYATGV